MSRRYYRTGGRLRALVARSILLLALVAGGVWAWRHFESSEFTPSASRLNSSMAKFVREVEKAPERPDDFRLIVRRHETVVVPELVIFGRESSEIARTQKALCGFVERDMKHSTETLFETYKLHADHAERFTQTLVLSLKKAQETADRMPQVRLRLSLETEVRELEEIKYEWLRQQASAFVAWKEIEDSWQRLAATARQLCNGRAADIREFTIDQRLALTTNRTLGIR